MFAPLLQKIGIALGFLDDELQGGLFKNHVLAGRRFLQRLARRRRYERADLGEIEEPLGVGFCTSHPAPELRKAGSHQDHRTAALRRTVERGDEGGQFLLLHILEFVDKQRERRPHRFGRRTRDVQQVLQIVFKIAVVRQAGLGIKIQTYLDILVFDLQRFGETRQGAQPSLSEITGFFLTRKSKESLSQLRGQQGGKRATFGSFDADGLDA